MLLFWGGSGWSAGGLVVAAGVEDQFAQQFAGGGVDDPDLKVLDEDQDVGSGVGSPPRRPKRATELGDCDPALTCAPLPVTMRLPSGYWYLG